MRGLTNQPFGVNLFMPQDPHTDPAAIEVYRHQLAGEVTWYETPLGEADGGGDDNYEAKLAILREDPVPVVSFTFGCPERPVFDAFAKVGTYTIVTVTTPRRRRPRSGRGRTRCVCRASRRAAIRARTGTIRRSAGPASGCSR